MPTFVFRSRYALLTYAQSDGLNHWSVLDMLSAIPAECVIAREAHADGGTHLHAFADFGERFYTGDARRFDVDGYHPNILAVGRTPGTSYDYCIKDGDIVAGGLDRPGGYGGDVSGAGSQWDRIVGAETADEFWSTLRELAPRTLLTNFNSCKAYADWHYRPVVAAYENPPGIEFDLSGVEKLREWVRDNLSGVRGRPKSLVLYGESRLGKTLWARSLGRHVYNCLQFCVDDMKADLDEALYAVFDDMQGGFKFFPSYKGWLGAQSKFTVTDKYRGKTTIQWGRPTIWICNESPSEWTDVDMGWMDKNCIFVEISSAIFRASID